MKLVDGQTSDLVGQPAYRRVAHELRTQIADGRLSIGSAIPSNAQLQAHYHVSSTVIRAAINELRTEGLLLGQPGKGVFVQATPESAQHQASDIRSIAASVNELAARLDEMTPDDATALNELREEVRELNRSIAMLQAHLLELYTRLGQPYPHRQEEVPVAVGKRRSSGSKR